MAFNELPPIQSKKPRTVRDGTGTIWHVRAIPAKPGAMGTAYCVLLFEREGERRWIPAITANVPHLSHTQLVRELGEAKPIRPGKVIPEATEPEVPRAFVDGEWEEES